MDYTSQNKAIYELLKSKEIVSLTEIMNLKTGKFPFRKRIANHTMRISELRRVLYYRGLTIKNTIYYNKDKKCRESYYSLQNIKLGE